jgi:hypothetical protein
MGTCLPQTAGEVLALTPDMEDLQLELNGWIKADTERVYLQKLKAKVLLIHTVLLTMSKVLMSRNKPLNS